LIFTEVEALDLLELIGLSELPIHNLIAMAESSLQVLTDPIVKGVDAFRIYLQIGNAASPHVLPGSLA